MATVTSRPLPARLAGALGAGILAGAVVVSAGPPVAAHTGSDSHDAAAYARTWAADQPLRPGCRKVRYRYEVDPPTDQAWGLETFLIGPRGKRIASGALSNTADRKKGRDTFDVCRTSTRPGKFRIRAKLTYYDGWTSHDGWADPTRFRLRRP